MLQHRLACCLDSLWQPPCSTHRRTAPPASCTLTAFRPVLRDCCCCCCRAPHTTHPVVTMQRKYALGLYVQSLSYQNVKETGRAVLQVGAAQVQST